MNIAQLFIDSRIHNIRDLKIDYSPSMEMKNIRNPFENNDRIANFRNDEIGEYKIKICYL